MDIDTQPSLDFVLLYDGNCPICQKEVAWLRWKNKQGRLGFHDINAADFNASAYGKTHDQLMAEIHGIYPDGSVIKGLEVFCAAYRAVGLGWLMAPLRWPVVKPLFESLYRLFARHRLRLGRLFGKQTCEKGHCRI